MQNKLILDILLRLNAILLENAIRHNVYLLYLYCKIEVVS